MSKELGKLKMHDLKKIQPVIESIYEGKTPLESGEGQGAIEAVIELLDRGELRVAARGENGSWMTQEWIKKAILLYFRMRKISVSHAAEMTFVDKIPLKRWVGNEGVRIVPPAVVRRGACVQAGAILMPSFVNIGAFVGEGTMVDTWATVGSCAQIGRNVHLSGGVGIGGVLEPLQASPVIIEDHVFIGSRCIVVEGVLIEEGAVLAAGVTITSSSKILDVSQAGKAIEYRGRVPSNSVVIPGVAEKEFPAGRYGVPCALIIGKRTESTDRKTSLTAALRDYGLSV
jgi:2,3,4,5-tetrahydropyridine-2-carboxylate N-succinyltransferase